MEGTRVLIPEGIAARALGCARLRRSALAVDSNPDDGAGCLRLDATIQEYGVFLVYLCREMRREAPMRRLADRTQLHLTESGETVFWLPGVELTP